MARDALLWVAGGGQLAGHHCVLSAILPVFGYKRRVLSHDGILDPAPVHPAAHVEFFPVLLVIRVVFGVLKQEGRKKS